MYRDKKKITIIAMLVAIVIMAIGYAAFSTNLNISGTANIESNWNVYISNVVVSETYGTATNMEGSPTFENLKATMHADFKVPGDWITYQVTVTNDGTFDAVIEEVKATNLGTSAIIHTISGLENGTQLAKGESIDFIVKIEYDANVTSQPDTLDNTLVLDIVCVQDMNQSITGGDIDINEATLTTLSGNNTLSLDSAFPATLANYKITGNSVQKNKNELVYPYLQTTRTANGVTFTDNGDGTITVNGTATSTTKFKLQNIKVADYVGYVISGGYDTGSSDTYWVGFNTIGQGDQGSGLKITTTHAERTETDDILIRIAEGYTAENLVIKPQLEKNEKTEWISQNPTPDAPIEVVSVGEKTSNLIPYPYSNETLTTAGVTWTVNEDRTVSCSGTPTAYSAFVIMNKAEITGGKTYSFNLGLDGEFENVALNITLFDSEGTSLSAIDLNSKYNNAALLNDILVETTETTKYISISVKRNDNNVETYAKFLPTLEEGTTTTGYEPYGYKIPVTVGGKNLVGEQTLIENGFVKQEDGSFWVRYSSTPKSKKLFVNEDKISGSMSISFYIKNVIDGNNFAGCYPYVSYTDGTVFSFSNLSVIGEIPTEFTKVEYTTPADKTIDYIMWSYWTGSTQTYIKDMQIALGEDFQYEPYVEPTITNIYLDEPLRCIGSYCDYIDFASSVVMRQTKMIVFKGSESWIKFSDKNLYYILDEELLYKGSVPCLSNKYKGQLSGVGGDHGNGDIWLQSVSTYPRIYIYDDNYTTVSDFKSYLKQNNVTGYFPLATAKPQSIDLPEIYIPQGNVRVSVSSNGLTIPIEVSYYKK